MAIRVLRLLEYVYETPEVAEQDMDRWSQSDDGCWQGGRVRMRSVALPFEVMSPEGGESLNDQVLRLAQFVDTHIEGEPSQSQGAIDTALRLLCEAEGIPHEVTEDGQTRVAGLDDGG